MATLTRPADPITPPRAAPLLRGVRCAILLADAGLGGAERQALLTGSLLRDTAGAEVSVWLLSDEPGPVDDRCAELGLPLHRRAVPDWLAHKPRVPQWPGLWRLTPTIHRAWRATQDTTGLRVPRRALRGLASALRRAGVDALLPYTYMPNLVAHLVRKPSGARLVVWNQRDHGLRLTGRPLERRALAAAGLVISNSAHGGRAVTHRLGAGADRLHVVPNGVAPAEPKRSRAAWRRGLGVGDDTPVACMVAHIHNNPALGWQRKKDHPTLVRAWGHVVRDWVGPEPVLVLAGRRDYGCDELAQLAARCGVGKQLLMPGPIDDVPGLLDACDLGVFSAVSEGTPNGVLECMARGLAVVGTDIPGVRDALGPDHAEWLCPVGDDRAMAALIRLLLLAPDMRWRVGQANRARVRGVFSPRRLGEQTASLIAEGLRGCSPTGRPTDLG